MFIATHDGHGRDQRVGAHDQDREAVLGPKIQALGLY